MKKKITAIIAFIVLTGAALGLFALCLFIAANPGEVRSPVQTAAASTPAGNITNIMM